MKKLFVGFGLALACLFGPRWGFAGATVSIDPYANSTYVSSHTTVSVSSNAVTTVNVASDRYRETYIGNIDNAGTTIYYKIDGTTNAIPTQGWYVKPGDSQRLEFNGPISMQLAAGVSGSVNVRILKFEK